MKILFFVIILILIPTVSALNNCGGTTSQDDIPCLLLLPFNETPLNCTNKSVQVFNEGSFLYSQPLGGYSPFKCNGTFNQSPLGTYNGQWSTGDTFTIVVVEGTRLILLLYFAIIITIMLLLFGFLKEDVVALSFAGFFMMALGVFIITQGFNLLDNLVTQTIGMVLIGVGFYVIFRANWEIWKASE